MPVTLKLSDEEARHLAEMLSTAAAVAAAIRATTTAIASRYMIFITYV